MEFIVYIIIFVVIVAGVAGFVQTVIYPPVSIQPDELPPVIVQELADLFPGFEPEQITLQKIRHRYRLQGLNSGSACRLSVDLTPDGELREIEFKDISGTTTFTNKTPIPNSAVPLHIADCMNPFLASDKTEMDSSRAYSGMIGSENAFQIKIQSEDFDYEFEFTESGRLVEFEKEHLSH